MPDNDPFSPESLKAGNTYPRAVSDKVSEYAKKLGDSLLFKGSASDATAGGQAYRMHVQESQAMGQTPMTPQQFQQSQAR